VIYPEDPAYKLVSGHSLTEEKTLNKKFERAKSWMHSCITSHTDCESPIVGELPTRVIELSPPNTPATARLRHSRGQLGSYIALSYCWGAPQPYRTTSSRVEAYTSELPYQSLPQSILDAFDVTRGLGLRNIWIDSLCIIQDDPEDLSREIGKMFSIYQNAQVTISAAKAANCNEGFLPQPLEVFCVPVKVNDYEVGELLLSKHNVKEVQDSKRHHDSNEHPINSRAWTLQEELLANRLLIFGHDEIAWKCQISVNDHADWCSSAGFLDYSLKDIVDTRHPATHAGRKENEPVDMSNQQNLKRLMWGYVLQHYMRRKLSEETDRLPAISAVAEFFAKYLGEKKDDYVAGLWRRTLIIDLLWDNNRELPSSRLSSSGAPSWSWASTNSQVGDMFAALAGPSDDFYECVDILRCSVVLANEHAPYGAVQSGELVLRGWLKKVWVGPGEIRHGERSQRVSLYEMTAARDLIERTIVRCDTSDDLVLEECTDIAGNDSGFISAWALTLGCKRWVDPFDDTNNRTSYGIILLEACPPHQEAFRRVAQFWASSLDKGQFWWEQCEKVTITIV
jgi:hypothetical protein